jgi:hypothetical protein
MQVEIGDYVEIVKDMTTVRGMVQGWRVNKDGDLKEIFIEEFYVSFDIGEDKWLIVEEEEDNGEI